MIDSLLGGGNDDREARRAERQARRSMRHDPELQQQAEQFHARHVSPDPNETNAPGDIWSMFQQVQHDATPDQMQSAVQKTIDSLTNYVPDLGVRTFWDLTESWNLEIEGDYGGFGVDDNRQTWQALALAGYRWPGWGVHWNIQAGYRAMRLFDLRKSSTEIKLDCRGPNVVLSMEF